MSVTDEEVALELLKRTLACYCAELHVSDREALSGLVVELSRHLNEPVREPAGRVAEIFVHEYRKLQLDEPRGSVVRRECRWQLASHHGESLLSPEIAAPPPFPCVAVCSDVHLGTRFAEVDAFYGWLQRSDPNEVVLLGDILDLWIFGAADDGDRLLERVAAAWDSLYKTMRAAKGMDRRIRFVPGNHDGFIYFLEAAECDPWASAVLSYCPELQRLRQMTQHQRLTEVSEIHYPCLSVRMGSRTVVLTHGHYAGWWWRLKVGLEDSVTGLPSQLAMAAVVLAHKNARLLRRLNNEKDWLKRVHGIEDTAIAITNAVLFSYEAAREMLRDNVPAFVGLIDRAMGLFFGGAPPMSLEEELKIRDSFNALDRLRRRHTVEHLRDVRDQHAGLFRDGRSDNTALYSSAEGVRLERSPLSAFEQFDDLVVGHYHVPRDSEGVAHDVGGFVDGIMTSLVLWSNGEVLRPGVEAAAEPLR